MAEENSTYSTGYHYHTLSEVLKSPKTALTAVFLVLLMLCTLVGNFLVIWTIFTTRRLRFSAFFFVASLAVADFLVGLVVLPISLAYHLTFEMTGRWILGSFTCKAWLLFNFWFCSASVLNLCLVSWDRYIAVTSPLHYKAHMSDTRVRKMIIISWTLSFSLSIILIAKANSSIDKRTNCTIHRIEDVAFAVCGVLLVFLIPVAFLIFVNARVWITARRHKKRITAVEDSMRLSFSNNWNYNLESRNSIDISPMLTLDSRGRSTSGILHQINNKSSTSERGGKTLTRTIKQEIKTFKTFLIVIGVFVVCWCPFYVSMLVDIVNKFSSFVFYITIVLGYCNSAMNIFIYGVFNKEFRKAMITSLKCCKVETF
ncbi:octopamine receptor-like [Actinia tenebrosa]|uniref:Octopamine receptor-like n=1 Tax=Actinia tenebrosa TaxID=6105 RepID=A0A6P8J043_ACTTE|nr:octopamine receptor-like [Actinia tenebrosa]